MLYSTYNIVAILAVFLAAVISITLHEYAHGFVALLNGDYTAKANGRLTLNPLKHFDPIGFLMMMTVGFGYAKPVPVNPNNFKKLKRGIFTVAIAGITVNIFLAFFSTAICLLMFKLLEGLAYKSFSYNLIYFLYLFFFYMSTINVFLAFFNLLPLYPLDGFRIVEAFTRYNNKVTSFLRTYGQYILIGLIGISVIIGYAQLEQSYPAFRYINLLDLYMDFFGGNIIRGFNAFWGLMIK